MRTFLPTEGRYRCSGYCTLEEDGEGSTTFDESWRANDKGALRIRFKKIWAGIANCEWPAFAIDGEFLNLHCLNGFERLPMRTFGK